MRIVIKIGSKLLEDIGGSLNGKIISDLVREIVSAIKETSAEFCIITSGAVRIGRLAMSGSDFRLINWDKKVLGYNRQILEEQVMAAIGQPKLIASYTKAFAAYGIECAQILTTRNDFANPASYLSLRTVAENLIHAGVIPIFNENDVLSPEELQGLVSDNDELAAMVAAMIKADKLIILTNVDGVLDGSPESPKSKIIPLIREPRKYISVVDESSRVGKGGMKSKLLVAQQVTMIGIDMAVANGHSNNVISNILRGQCPGTYFPAQHKKVKPAKNWIATAAVSKGKIIVSTLIADLLRRKEPVSVVLKGILSVEGDFRLKDVVEVCDENGLLLGKGQVKMDSLKIKSLVEKNRHQSQIADLDMLYDRDIIHYDFFVFS